MCSVWLLLLAGMLLVRGRRAPECSPPLSLAGRFLGATGAGAGSSEGAGDDALSPAALMFWCLSRMCVWSELSVAYTRPHPSCLHAISRTSSLKLRRFRAFLAAALLLLSDISADAEGSTGDFSAGSGSLLHLMGTGIMRGLACGRALKLNASGEGAGVNGNNG